jgi:hypothetical protein
MGAFYEDHGDAYVSSTATVDGKTTPVYFKVSEHKIGKVRDSDKKEVIADISGIPGVRADIPFNCPQCKPAPTTGTITEGGR